MKHRLTKFFYSELLRLSRYRFDVGIYNHSGFLVCLSDSAYINITRPAFGISGCDELYIDMPTVYFEGSPLNVINYIFDVGQSGKHFTVKAIDHDTNEEYEYYAIMTDFEVPKGDIILENPLFLKIRAIVIN